ncbi:MAG: OmpP1/FadL family transporter [Myxococcota bacterium]
MQPRASAFSLALGAGFLASAPAQAGNEDEFFLGSRAAMTAGAVVASVSDGSAAFNNPAGLANAERSSIDVSASAYSIRVYRAPKFLSVDNGPTKDASVSEFLAIPTEFAYLRRLSEGISLGLGYFVPRSSDFVLRENLQAPEVGGVSNFGLNLRQSRTDYLFIAALGWRVARVVRLGFGASGALENQVDAAALFGAVTRGMAARKSLQSDEFSTTWAFGMELSLGAQIEVTPQLTLGVALRSPRLRVWQSVDGRSNTSAGSLEPGSEPGLATASSNVNPDGHALAFVRAGRYIGGLALRLGAGMFHADVDMQPGLRDVAAGVDRRFTLNGRVGYSYEVSPHFSLGAGLFSDRATERKGFSLVGARGDFYGGTLGIELNNLHHLAPGEPARSLQLSTVFALRYARSDGTTTTLRAHPELPTQLLFEEANGKITIHEIGLHVGSALYF